MAKFKKGDKVRILDGSKIKDYAYGWNSDMKKCIGKLVTIKEILHNLRGQIAYKVNENSWSWDERSLAPVNNEKIVITTDGKTTTARLYNGNEVIKTAKAECCESDTFDFKIGAELAFERLFSAFKIGDKVVAKRGAPYGITTNGWKGIIIDIRKDEIKVTGKDHWGGTDSFWVDAEWFDLSTEKELLNTKICIVEGDDKFKTGQIYDVVDGKITTRDGDKVPYGRLLASMEDLRYYFSPEKERNFDKSGWNRNGIKFVEIKE